VSSGSPSEAAGVFDPDLMAGVLRELAEQAVPLTSGRQREALAGLTAVDGSIFTALPRMAWALWQDAEHRGVKLHLHFDVLCGVPRRAVVTPAASSEPGALQRTLEPGRLYVVDRGYADYELFADVVLARLGTPHHRDHLKHPMRLVIVRVPARDGKPGRTEDLWLITDRLELSADLVALAYRYRWSVELFFRWLKCVLGTRHLIGHKPRSVAWQMYAALLVSLLPVLYTGRNPTKRTFEAVQFYLVGWVSDEELQRHLETLQPIAD